MSTDVNRQWRVAARPDGNVKPADFEYTEQSIPNPGEGEVLLKTHYLSLAPVMRMYMMGLQPTDDAKLEIGDVIHGRGVGEVMASNHPEYQAGDILHGQMGWQTYKVSKITKQERFRKMRKQGLPIYLGLTCLGFSGFSAFCGYFDRGFPKPGDVVLVSGAAGGVGHMVIQIARAAGASRVIGIAGGPEKVKLITDLGCDAAIDYKSEDVPQRIAELIPEGIDLYFDNVGGETLEAAINNLAMDARIVLCGSISEYTRDEKFALPNYTILRKHRACMNGFFVYHHPDSFDRAELAMGHWIKTGQLKPIQTILDGFENMPQALADIYDGKNLGKQLVRVEAGADDMVY